MSTRTLISKELELLDAYWRASNDEHLEDMPEIRDWVWTDA